MIEELLSVWTVFDKPTDYPAQFVARRFVAARNGAVYATPDAVFALTLEGVRAKLPPGLTWMGRNEGDEPHIVESWL